VTRAVTTAWATWLQLNMGAFVFPVDHPGLPECAGWHKPGWPCDGKRGKHPACKWSRDSTDNPDVIRAAVGRGLRNVGLDCGKSGLLIVDEDVPGAFTMYAGSAGQVIPETFTVATAQGRHLYFRQPPDPLGNGTGALPDGIDIRGRGGFVVAPGSVHQTGVLYTPADPGVPIAPVPEWLVSVLRSPAEVHRTWPPAGRERQAAAPVRLRGVLAVVLDAQPGQRNSRLYWASCRAAEMVATGELDRAVAVQVLGEAGEATGLGPSEVQATIDSALKGVLA
jgi:hypothetical protein